ncbi:uncharacterized protein LOC143476192 [Brachyhypopomus gauderio]|uniref:uncharacterized protein LOC143476192 n=1 Tax=Brachyhypopomus gauderio TaxID=698409 RepID=UPI00404263A5
MASWLICTAVWLILIGQISAVSEPDLALRDSRTAACQNQHKLSSRLDTVEKRVQDTVQKLESELSVLLDAIESPEWIFLANTDSATPAVDILDGSQSSPQS